jgi:hypothetical protein
LYSYLFPVAAALSVALGAAGGALAGAKAAKHPAHARAHGPAHVQVGTSLLPRFVPHPAAWLEALQNFPRNPKPSHRKPVHARKAKPVHAQKAKAVHVQKPAHAQTAEPRRATTLSIYEQTTKPWFLGAQGCSAAKRHETGIVILDFGKPASKHHGYGTILFSGRYADNHHITTAMVAYARGYIRCLPKGSTASIELARGTSNYHPAVPSAYSAGVRWARATNTLARTLAREGLDEHVTAAAADDAEPAWDPAFRKTRAFFHGFRVATHGHTLYNYGSLDGGVGEVWSAKQAWYVAGGIRHTKALPEIYNSAMAAQWAELARIARSKYHRGVQFAGVMTQGMASCSCGLRPHAAHRVLADALDAEGVTNVVLPDGGTNIVG